MSSHAPLQRESVSTVPPRRVWFALVAAPVAWAAQGLLGWFVSGAGCHNDQSFWGVPLSTLSVIAIVASVIALGVGVAAIAVAFREWSRSGERTDLQALDGRTRASYLAGAGVLISAVFTVAIAWAGVGVILVNPCGQMR